MKKEALELTRLAGSASFFKIKLNILLDTLIQKIFFEIIKVKKFRGELTDNSAKKEALLAGGVACAVVHLYRYSYQMNEAG